MNGERRRAAAEQIPGKARVKTKSRTTCSKYKEELELHLQSASHHFCPAFQRPASAPRIHLPAYSPILCAHTCTRKRRIHYLPLCHNGELWSWVSRSLISTPLWFLPEWQTVQLVGVFVCVSMCARAPVYAHVHAGLILNLWRSPPSYCTLLHHINKPSPGFFDQRSSCVLTNGGVMDNNELQWSAVDVYSCSYSLNIPILVIMMRNIFWEAAPLTQKLFPINKI